MKGDTLKRLAGRVGLIAGASGALGSAVALRMACEGARLALLGRDRQRLERVGLAVGEAGAEYGLFIGDLREPGLADQTVAEVVRRFEGVDILVNAVGERNGGPFAGVSDDQWDTVFQTNVKLVYQMTRAAVPWLEASPFGRIINFSSIGQNGVVHQANYAAAKGAIAALTRSLALELGPQNITVNSVVPGLMATSKSKVVMGPVWDSLIQRIPLRRAGTPEEVAGTVAYLASDDASYVTGQSIYLSGGLHAMNADLPA